MILIPQRKITNKKSSPPPPPPYKAQVLKRFFCIKYLQFYPPCNFGKFWNGEFLNKHTSGLSEHTL